MNIDSWFSIEEKLRPRTIRRWISRSKNQYQDLQVQIYVRVRDIDSLYCNSCGAMPDKAYGTPDPNDPMLCMSCFKNQNSANEFLV